jgi:anti-sigma B factor antagonist
MPEMPESLIPLGGRAKFLPQPFACSWTNGAPDSANVHIIGELDIATTPELQRTLREPQLQAQLVVLDLREVAFIDASGVHAIVNASLRAREIGHRLVLLRGGLDVDRVFTLTGSSGDVEIVDFDPRLTLADEHP